MLSDVPGAAEGPGTHHNITAETQQNSDSAKLSNAKVGDEAMLASLVYWHDLESPYQLMRFGDMEDFGVSEVCVHVGLCAGRSCLKYACSVFQTCSKTLLDANSWACEWHHACLQCTVAPVLVFCPASQAAHCALHPLQ